MPSHVLLIQNSSRWFLALCDLMSVFPLQQSEYFLILGVTLPESSDNKWRIRISLRLLEVYDTFVLVRENEVIFRVSSGVADDGK